MRRVADHEPACIDEKKALARAKKRLEVAQEKIEAVRRFERAIDHQVDEYRGARTPLASWLDSESVKALAALHRMMDNLEDYLALQSRGGAAAASAASTPAAERQDGRAATLPTVVEGIPSAAAASETAGEAKRAEPEGGAA
jgi:hypothetical protein